MNIASQFFLRACASFPFLLTCAPGVCGGGVLEDRRRVCRSGDELVGALVGDAVQNVLGPPNKKVLDHRGAVVQVELEVEEHDLQHREQNGPEAEGENGDDHLRQSKSNEQRNESRLIKDLGRNERALFNVLSTH